jgi:hypothetical protein
MIRALFLLIPLASGCLIPVFDGNGNGGGLFNFRYTEQDFQEDFAEVGCEYVMTCFEVFNSVEECERDIIVNDEPCPNFIPEQARDCIDDVEDATETCGEFVTTDESACANVCG